MNPETLFSAANVLAMIGWVLLILHYLLGDANQLLQRLIHGYWIPLILSVGYFSIMGLLLAGLLPSSEAGSFASIRGVRSLFESDYALLGGWIHYLAFDLIIGMALSRAARESGLSIWWMLPVWFFTFMFGPVGYVLWRGLALVRKRSASEVSLRIPGLLPIRLAISMCGTAWWLPFFPTPGPPTWHCFTGYYCRCFFCSLYWMLVQWMAQTTGSSLRNSPHP